MAGYQAGNRARFSPFDLDGDALTLRERAARTNAQSSRRTTGGAAASQRGNWSGPSPAARVAVGVGADALGLVFGIPRGVWHTAKDAYGAAQFFSRLTNPVYDNLTSPPGETASDQVLSAGQGLVDYARNAWAHPKSVGNDVKGGLRRFGAGINPFVSRPADTLGDVAARSFNAGLNQGEAAFDVASLLYGGGEARALAGLGKISKEARVARFRALGHPEGLSNYFAETYDGMGHHFWPRAKELPGWLGGGLLPQWISDSSFNVLKPRNISNGDFFKLHFGVDPKYYGGKIGAKFAPGGWSGRKLGWTKRDQLGRLWYGSPKPLKAVVGGGLFGSTGAIVDQVWDGEGQR